MAMKPTFFSLHNFTSSTSRLLGNADLVAGDTDVTYHPLTLQLLNALVHPRAVTGRVAGVRAVELIYVNIVCAKVFKGCLDLALDLVGSLCAGFCGDGHLVTDILKGDTALYLAVRVGARRVEEGHTALVGAADQPDCRVGVVTLYGKGTEGVLGCYYTGGTECYAFHFHCLLISVL